MKDLIFICKQIFTLLLASCWSTLCLHPMRHSHSPLEALRRPGLPRKSSSENSYTSKGCRDPSGEGSNAVADSWWLAVPLQWKNVVSVSCAISIKYSLVCMCHSSESAQVSICATAVIWHKWACMCHCSESGQVSLDVQIQWECTGESICATAVRLHRWVYMCHCSDMAQLSLYMPRHWECTGESTRAAAGTVYRWT